MDIDTESSVNVEMTSLLKALLAKLFLTTILDPGNDAALLEAQRKAAVEFDGILSEAVRVCNADRSLQESPCTLERCKEIKESLRSFLRSPVENCGGYQPLAVFLNAALLHSAGDLADKDDDAVLFIPNDPVLVTLGQLENDDSTASKWEPYLIALHASYIRSWNHKWQDDNLEATKTRIAQIINPRARPADMTWSNVLAFVEVKRSEAKLDLTPLDGEYSLDTSDGVVETPITNPDVPDIRCGFHGLERLRCTWSATHSFVLLVQGPMLQLQWYDPQGLIQTHPISLVTQLPLVLAMLSIFQRFDHGMWGIPEVQVSAERDGIRWAFKPNPSTASPPGSRWIGRHTYTADVEWAAEGESTTDEAGQVRASMNRPVSEQPPCTPNAIQDSFFFKASWTEIWRDKEPDIVAEARRRSKRYLGEYGPYVIDHIPTILNSQELGYTSTAIIRKLLSLGSDHLKASQVLLWFVSVKLAPLTELEPTFLWAGLRELIRCHYLLWKIGIAHGDISLSNLMYDPNTKTAVLNGFDLAELMNPGDASPAEKGREQTGATLFMALEQLKNPNPTIPHRYRHDLESFYWRLIWLCSTRTESDISADCETFEQAFGHKSTHLFHDFRYLEFKSDLAALVKVIKISVGIWEKEWKKQLPPKGDLGTQVEVSGSVNDDDNRCLEQWWPCLQGTDPIPGDDSWINFSVVPDTTMSSVA